MVQLVETNLEAAIGWDTLVPLSKLDFSVFEGRCVFFIFFKYAVTDTR